MAAATYEISEIRRGNSFAIGFRFKDGEGDGIDLTGSIIVFSIEITSGVLRKFSNLPGSGCEITDAVDGEISINLTAIETRTLKLGRGTRYEVERWINGEETTLISGLATVVEGINNDD